LKALVGIMGVLIVLGTAVVIGVVIHRIYAKPAVQSMIGVVPGAAAGAPVVSGVLPPGEHIAGIAAAGGDVAVWVTGPAGDRVLLVNPETGVVSVAVTAAR
jgi:hypothetical protein